MKEERNGTQVIFMHANFAATVRRLIRRSQDRFTVSNFAHWLEMRLRGLIVRKSKQILVSSLVVRECVPELVNLTNNVRHVIAYC